MIKSVTFFSGTPGNSNHTLSVIFSQSELFLLHYADFPVFTSSLPSVATAIEGIQKPITCIVKSRPASNITWSHDVGVVGMATQNVMQDGYYFITTGTFTMEKPVYSMRGKKIFCTGEPKFGAPIKQNTTLNVLCEYTVDSFLPKKAVPNLSAKSLFRPILA